MAQQRKRLPVGDLPDRPPALDGAYVAWVKRRRKSMREHPAGGAGISQRSAISGLRARKPSLSVADCLRLLDETEER